MTEIGTPFCDDCPTTAVPGELPDCPVCGLPVLPSDAPVDGCHPTCGPGDDA